MRHRKAFNHLGRTPAHRKAMLSNMATSLIMHKRINTTTAKAKALKKYVEPLVTKAKIDNTHNRRRVFQKLQDKNAVSELFRNVVVKVGERPGGYTRILKTENRLGDNAEMCIIELVDYNENMLAVKEDEKSKKKRSRRGGRRRGASKKAESAAKDQPEEKAVEEKPRAETETPADTNDKQGTEKEKEQKPEKPETGKESKAEAHTDDASKGEEKKAKEADSKIPESAEEKPAAEKKETAKPEAKTKKEDSADDKQKDTPEDKKDDKNKSES
jgi:large subunit ribosomal protein L17